MTIKLFRKQNSHHFRKAEVELLTFSEIENKKIVLLLYWALFLHFLVCCKISETQISTFAVFFIFIFYLF
jgi:hypothetical protein